MTGYYTGNYTQQTDRSSGVAHEALPVTAPRQFEDSSGQLVQNDDQVEKLLAHIHKRLPRSKPARALLQDTAADHGEAESTNDDEFLTISSQLQLRLEGGGIHLSVVGTENGVDGIPESEASASAATEASRHSSGLGFETGHDVALSTFAEILAGSWLVPGGAEDLVASQHTGRSLNEDHIRQRKWLQQLLDRPQGPASAPLQHKVSGGPLYPHRTSGCSSLSL